ncbi:2OG-Fe dioxygenase family protein [Rhodanobacter sp. AS-Z3]|uniref:2OG-Fe dioxygenase family protein n=1 Tax=Rhodanobacter sp. AS-Z3 TaxID=3031330 RepID=UPI0024798E2B|nr:2OG-Fe dioxygenase family protein [Rhodanobacter sp. AS-Z3]WEN14890.1 2OG-Fe dioxygenase family protein [Rhodanobacter sp. AS-Z3]
MTPHPDTSALHTRLQRDGFAFATAETMRSLLPVEALTDWPAFVASWNDLAPDSYLAASGRHRRRRHATFSAETIGGVRAEAHQPHYQSLKYNPLQGDILRWFEPVQPDIVEGASLRRILAFCHACFGALAPEVARWHVEVHQFRIEARADEAGEPTPEGVHRDGVDYVLVLLIDRENIERGTTTIHTADRSEIGHFTLTHPLDAALVDDHRVFHGVTAVTPLDPALPAHRDVLVVTFRRQAEPA